MLVRLPQTTEPSQCARVRDGLPVEDPLAAQKAVGRILTDERRRAGRKRFGLRDAVTPTAGAVAGGTGPGDVPAPAGGGCRWWASGECHRSRVSR